ncbi:MAG: IS1 family transposase, partial [Mariniblastus sp.]
PTTGAKPNRRNGRGNSQTADSDAVTGLATNSRPRGSRSSKPGLAPSISGTADFESPTMASQGTADNSDLESASTTLSKSDTEAMEQAQGSELDIDAIEGPAGLGSRPADRIGVMTRPSARDSEQLMPEMKNRFRNKNFGGTPALNPNAVLAKEAFQGRSPATVASAAEPSTEAAIHLGLEFLARYQLPDGSWSLKGFDRNAPQRLSQLNSDTAATGLALLSFQGAGYNHREFKYAQQIDRALQWLIDNQADDGMLYISSDPKSDQACQLYSHGIAALALTEAYGMTQDSQLKEPAQKAIDFIVNSQHARKGGWRYYSEPIKSRSTDTSVTGWMMMAMQSGRLAGLKIPKETFTGVEGWLDEAADPENSSLYRYNHWLQDANGVSRIQGREASVSMTSVGLLMRIYSGWDSDDPRLLAGADYLLNKQLPSDTTPLLRDTYYWYYATQVLKHIDGPRWKQWNDKLRPLLTKSQVQTGEMAGSWHPYKPVPDRWGQFGGRLYVTTMNLLNLEVRHRMLPLYKQNKAQE